MAHCDQRGKIDGVSEFGRGARRAVPEIDALSDNDSGPSLRKPAEGLQTPASLEATMTLL